MLTITRRQGERIYIGDDIVIMVSATKGSSVRLSIDAPREVRIIRGELVDGEVDDVEYNSSSGRRAGGSRF